MWADKNPLMDYYDDLKDLIDELKEAYYVLINAWSMAEEKTRYIRNELEEGETE